MGKIKCNDYNCIYYTHQLYDFLEKNANVLHGDTICKLKGQSLLMVAPRNIQSSSEQILKKQKLLTESIFPIVWGLPIAKSNMWIFLGILFTNFHPLTTPKIWINICFPPEVLWWLTTRTLVFFWNSFLYSEGLLEIIHIHKYYY